MTTQTQRMLDLLRHGPVTPLKAWVEAGIYRCADSVEKLRKFGHKIDTNMVDFTTSRGYKVKFAEYVLVKEKKR